MSKDSSAKYNQDNKERLQSKACERHQSLSKQEKEKKQQHGRERYKNLPIDEKQKLIEYKKYITKWGKTPYYSYKKLFSLNFVFLRVGLGVVFFGRKLFWGKLG